MHISIHIVGGADKGSVSLAAMHFTFGHDLGHKAGSTALMYNVLAFVQGHF